MKTLERILLILISLGFAFKLLNIPGGNVIIYCSLLPSSLFYFFFSFAVLNDLGFHKIFKTDSYNSISSRHGIVSVYLGMAFSVFLLGLIYSILNYEPRMLLLGAGTVYVFLCLLLSGFYYFKTRTYFWKKVLIRSSFFIFLFALQFIIR